MVTETDLHRTIQVELSSAETRLWRNTCGFGWQGSNFTIRKGVLVAGNARPVTFGLGPGSSDLIGAHSVIITPAMIGQKIAVLVGIETKKPQGRIKISQEQENFIGMLNSLGGLGGFARSVEDARRIVTRFDRWVLT